MIRNFRLHELREEDEGLLPAHVAGFGGDHGGDAFLGDVPSRPFKAVKAETKVNLATVVLESACGCSMR